MNRQATASASLSRRNVPARTSSVSSEMPSSVTPAALASAMPAAGSGCAPAAAFVRRRSIANAYSSSASRPTPVTHAFNTLKQRVAAGDILRRGSLSAASDQPIAPRQVAVAGLMNTVAPLARDAASKHAASATQTALSPAKPAALAYQAGAAGAPLSLMVGVPVLSCSSSGFKTPRSGGLRLMTL